MILVIGALRVNEAQLLKLVSDRIETFWDKEKLSDDIVVNWQNQQERMK